jgi:hypothetical protein
MYRNAYCYTTLLSEYEVTYFRLQSLCISLEKQRVNETAGL